MIDAAPTELSAERPFPGLRPFGYEDREFFFGRETDHYALYRLLDCNRFIAVVGSSGCGKSSLVRAGFLPLLDDETREGKGRSWRTIAFTPGNAPLERLADALVTLAPAGTTERSRPVARYAASASGLHCRARASACPRRWTRSRT